MADHSACQNWKGTMPASRLPSCRRALRARLFTPVLVSCLLSLGTGARLLAQAAPTPPGSAPAAKSTTTSGTTAAAASEPVQSLEKFTVTGSYIPTNKTAFTAGASPVVRIDRKVIDETGLNTVSEVL